MSTNFEQIVAEAERAGRKAGLECRPVPMVVGQMLDPSKPDVLDLSKPIYHVDDGACGFAWVQFKGNTTFGRWMKKTGRARSAYPTGLCVWVSEFGQSVVRKEAYAGAYAKVLNDNGLKCYASSRLD